LRANLAKRKQQASARRGGKAVGKKEPSVFDRLKDGEGLITPTIYSGTHQAALLMPGFLCLASIGRKRAARLLKESSSWTRSASSAATR
jgi:hypothetical protein